MPRKSDSREDRALGPTAAFKFGVEDGRFVQLSAAFKLGVGDRPFVERATPANNCGVEDGLFIGCSTLASPCANTSPCASSAGGSTRNARPLP